jgi:hypothetical protein
MSWLADPKNWFGRYAATGPVDWTPNQGFGLPRKDESRVFHVKPSTNA